jgi:cobalt-zinc-cadmium efflux system outer membrane protein
VQKRAVPLITVCFIVSNISTCRAQATLSLHEAVEKALSSRASLRAENERVAASQGLAKQAGLLPNPEFQFQNENLRPGQTYGRDVDTLAMINQPLDVLGKRKQRMALAAEGVTRAGADRNLARWQVIQRVKSAYWTARGSQEILEVLKASIDNFQKIVDYNAAQFSQGAIAEQDLLRVRLEAERLKITREVAAIEAGRDRVELLREMGQSGLTDVTLTEPFEPQGSIANLSVDQALANRAEIKAARAAVAQARANARLQDVDARPDLNLTAGYKRTQLPDTTSGVNTAIVSVRITLPVADKNQGNRMAAEAEVRRQEQLLAEVEAQARADYYGALEEYQLRRNESENNLAPLRTHAMEIAAIANAAYAEGGVELLRLLDAERVRLEADLTWARGIADYRQSIVRLETAEGIEQ